MRKKAKRSWKPEMAKKTDMVAAMLTPEERRRLELQALRTGESLSSLARRFILAGLNAGA